MAEDDIPGSTSSTTDELNANAAAADKLNDSNTRLADTQVKLKTNTDATAFVLNGLTNISKSVSSQFDIYNTNMNKANASISQMTNLSNEQARALGMVSAAVFGVQTQFRNIGDSSNLSTFGKSLQTLTDTVENRKTLLGTITSMAEKLGAKLPEGIGTSMTAMKAFAISMLNSADNATYAQNAFIQMSAVAGNLSEVFAAAGPNLENINAVMGQQIDLLNQTAKASGLPKEEIEKYWFSLGKIPGALTAVVRGTNNVGESISMLAATTAFARGSGRSYEAVLGDLSTAYKDFGATGNDALNIISGLGDVASKSGTSFESVHTALLSSASALRDFSEGGKSASQTMQGLSGIMLNYTDGLRKTGLSADVSMGIVKQMTDQIGKLTTAQKAFLSSQSGGPGGLRGANMIDSMIRKGDIEGVFEMAQKSMRKQFGTIVTQEQASQSEYAARQFEKQKQLLQKGPLGQLVGNDQQAARVLESFKARDEGRGGKISLSPVEANTNKILDTGLQLQRQGNNTLTRIATGLEANQRSTDQMNRGTINGFVTPPGMQGKIDTQINDSLQRGARTAEQTGTTMKTGTFNTQMTNENTVANGRDIINGVTQDIPSIIKSGVSSVLSNPATADARSREALNRAARATNPQMPGILSDDDLNNPGGALPPGLNVGRAVGASTRNASGRATAAPGVASNTPASTETTTNDVNIRVTGYCIKCQHEIAGTEQMHSVSPASKQTP